MNDVLPFFFGVVKAAGSGDDCCAGSVGDTAAAVVNDTDGDAAAVGDDTTWEDDFSFLNFCTLTS